MATTDGDRAAAADGRPRHEVADVFRVHGDAYRQSHRLPPSALRVMHAIERCRTAPLGGHLERCTDCGFERPAYNSCRNRHCPKCQSLATARWLDARQAEILPVPYFHTVFTLPHDLNPLILANKACLYQILFEAVADTLLTFGADPRHRLGGQLGFLAILHTWDQQLRFHVHLHCVVPGGALDVDGDRWIPTRATFLFPVRALSRAFRRRFLTRLAAAWRERCLVVPASLPASGSQAAFRAWLAALARKDWVVYAKPPFGGPATVLEYLARYTHRVALSNHRLTAIGDGHVSFTYRDRQHGNVTRTLTLPAESFIDRLLLHVLPLHFLRIRHVGFLANRTKKARLAQCRRLLHAPAGPDTRDRRAHSHPHRTRPRPLPALSHRHHGDRRTLGGRPIAAHRSRRATPRRFLVMTRPTSALPAQLAGPLRPRSAPVCPRCTSAAHRAPGKPALAMRSAQSTPARHRLTPTS